MKQTLHINDTLSKYDNASIIFVYYSCLEKLVGLTISITFSIFFAFRCCTGKRKWTRREPGTSSKDRGMYIILVFPRDGTSRSPFFPRQKNFLVPVSLCPGTRAEANVPGQNELKFFKKNDQISCFRASFSCFRTSFSVIEHRFLF